MAAFDICLFLCLFTAARAATVPTYEMNDGRQIPAVALGTYLGFDKNGAVKSQDNLLRDVILQAIDVGYRHFDTASIYSTEQEIGQAVRMKVEEGTVTREEIFITSKLWNTQHRREEVVKAVRDSLTKFGLDYIDLYLMHWPIGLNEDYSYSDVDYLDTWRGMEDAQQLGLVRSIGLSNFNRKQLERVIKEGSVKPAVLQIEIHPQLIQTSLVNYAQSQGVVVMGFSPFGSLVKRFGVDFPGPKLDDPTLSAIAKKYGKTTPQVVLRWIVERNIIPIPKTVKYSRLKENINIFDFELNEEEMQKINEFDDETRYTLPSFWQSHPYYPFDKIDNPVRNPFARS
ncbi:aldo-keto reductase AKR2E4 [Bicyclus anynana]|uniref:Aldo-keto reductase AKR2E4 n=1 Tax=Bicyclus anynana TaxID=110368 RepID=A0A6J1MQX5_BICAN|nr:aldo-keto reductase AKR2E4 [Bicyclus anynana]